MTIGEKIRQIRLGRGLSQENLARDVGCGVATISRIERGLTECDGKMLHAIKNAMDVANAPLTEAEIATYRETLHVWLELMSGRRIDDAVTLGKELAVILHLPYEYDMILLYKIYEAGLSITIGDYNVVEEKMDVIAKNMKDMKGEHLFQFYRNQGTLRFRREDYEQGLKYSLKALDYSEYARGNLASAYYNVAVEYSMLNKPIQALIYLEKARNLHKDSPLNILSVFIDHVFAKSYLLINELERAKDLLDPALLKAEAIGAKLGRKKYIGMILNLLGIYYVKKGEQKTALSYFERAQEFFWVGGLDYFNNSYYKIRCHLELKQTSKAKDLLTEVIENAVDNERYNVIFNGLQYQMSLKDNGAANHLETITIPFLLQKHEYFYALDFCKVLECHYKKLGNTKKYLEIAVIMRDIYQKILLG